MIERRREAVLSSDLDDRPILMVTVGISNQGVKHQITGKQVAGADDSCNVGIFLRQRGRRIIENAGRNPRAIENMPDALDGMLGNFAFLTLWVTRIDNVGQ